MCDLGAEIRKSKKQPMQSLGGVRASRVVGACFVLLFTWTPLIASEPIGPVPLRDEEVLLLLDMGAGDVRPATVDAVVQCLLAREFGDHFAAAILAWAVHDQLVTEGAVREALARYACENSTRRSSLACHFTLQRFEQGLRVDWSASHPAPECTGSGMDLFEGHGFERLSRAFLRSQGDPELVELAQSVPAETLDAVEHPRGFVVINGPTDNRPLFCTFHAWRRLQPPNRYLAYLEQLRCSSR